MAILTKDEMLAKISAITGKSTSDDVLSLIEDVSDTLDSMKDVEDWRSKYEQLDSTWRQRYKDRFFSDVDNEDMTEIKEEKIKSYDELFERK